MSQFDDTLAKSLIDHWDDTGTLVPGILHLNADGSISFGENTAVKGVSWTGVKPATVAGAGTAAGTFYSVTAPPGGDSTGAAGGGGGSLSLTTGAAGASFSGGANGGDLLVALGPNTGTGSRSGQVQITAIDTSSQTGVQYNAALMVTQTVTPGAALVANRQAASFLLTSQGDASLYNGAQVVGMSAIESRHHSEISGGTVNNLLYGAEFQFAHNGSATLSSVTTVQSDTAVSAGAAGTVTSWTGYRHAPGPFNNVTVVTLTGFTAADYTFLASDQPVKNHNGFAGQWLGGSLNHTDTAGGYVSRGVLVPYAVQGGNTSATNDNMGVHVAVAAISGSGGGVAGAGGVVRNRGVVIDMPTAQAVVGSNLNFGLDITGNIAGNDANNTTYATHQDIRWTAGAGGSTQIANRWSISANSANSGRLENFRIESTMNSTATVVANWWDIVAGAPTYTAGTVTNKIGIVSRNQGNASATSAVGIAIETQSASTNNTSLLIGATTPPTGSFSIYNSNPNVHANVASFTNVGAVTDGYLAAWRATPTYDGAFTVTRHNYFDLNNPLLTNSAVLTDAAVFRFDAAAGTHKAVDAGTTKTTPGTVNAWVKVNVNGTLNYLPAYTSKTA